MDSNRIQRVNQLIKKELSQLLLRENDFSEKVLVTVTRVEASIGLKQAEVYISAIPKEGISRIVQTLNNGVFGIQQKLNKRLAIRPVPKIRFVEEGKTVEAGRIEELLERIKNQG